MRKITPVFFGVFLLALTGVAWAQESEVETLRNENAALRAQVDLDRSVDAKRLAEIDKLRAENLDLLKQLEAFKAQNPQTDGPVSETAGPEDDLPKRDYARLVGKYVVAGDRVLVKASLQRESATRVVQVLGPDDLLVEIWTDATIGVSAGPVMHVTDAKTEGMIDGQSLQTKTGWPDVIVTGTHKYIGVDGASHTIRGGVFSDSVRPATVEDLKAADIAGELPDLPPKPAKH